MPCNGRRKGDGQRGRLTTRELEVGGVDRERRRNQYLGHSLRSAEVANGDDADHSLANPRCGQDERGGVGLQQGRLHGRQWSSAAAAHQHERPRQPQQPEHGSPRTRELRGR